MLKKTLAILYILTVIAMATATIIEKNKGTHFVASHIYNAPWFTTLWILLTGLGIVYIARQKLRKWNLLLLHLSFVIILTGALLTHLTSYRGTVHLRIGETTRQMMQTDGKAQTTERELPFKIKLNRFKIIYHTGTKAEADYQSHITLYDERHGNLSGVVSMNNILSHRGIRFYQSAYDDDRRGSTLAVNSDPYGIPTTYLGYLLLFFSLIWLLIDPRGSFRRLLKSDSLRKSILTLSLLFALTTIQATTTFPKETAAEFGKLYILYNNRVCPLQTFAVDFTKKLCGKSTYRGCTPEQVLTGFIFWGNEWANEPILKTKSGSFKKTLQLADYLSVNSLFDHAMGSYRLAPYVEEYYHGQQDPFHEQAVQLDDKVKLIMDLRQGTLLTLFPYTAKGQTCWYSPTARFPRTIPATDRSYMQQTFNILYQDALIGNNTHLTRKLHELQAFQVRHAGTSLPGTIRTRAELLYNRIPFATLLFMTNLALGLLALFYFIYRLTHNTRPAIRRDRFIFRTLAALLAASLAALTCCLSLRWIIAGHIPMTNGYETMLLLAWFVMLFALLTHSKARIILIFGFLLSGFFLLVSHINQMDPAITHRMPVLNSPLLSVHVSLIMMSYALLALTFVCGLMGLALKRHAHHFQLLSRLFLYPAVSTMGLGIFIGAIWANISWGSYWNWDPKETWALITFMLYAVVLHTHSFPVFRRPTIYHLYMIAAFLSIVMTYFGVNYLLGGMHSYA